jgi:hypothetical protein
MTKLIILILSWVLYKPQDCQHDFLQIKKMTISDKLSELVIQRIKWT